MRFWAAALASCFLASSVHASAHQQVFKLNTSNYESTQRERQYSKSIAIVGAGSAGLAALKALLDLPLEIRRDWDIVLFEERRNVGGVWLPDPNQLHPPTVPETPLYPLLKTNTPHPTMTYPHFPFPPNTPLFPSHEYVQQYHYDYARSFGLVPYIRLNTSVVRAEWVGNASSGSWNVTTSDKSSNRENNRSFDHIISANGHYRYPRIPTWTGQDAWVENAKKSDSEREILHSVYWRNGTKYKGKTVLVVGGGGSARDVVLHTAPYAKEILLSIRSGPPPSRLDAPYTLKPGIERFTPNGIVFTDGTEVYDIDAVILGTGYELRVPFLTSGGALSVISPSSNSTPSTSVSSSSSSSSHSSEKHPPSVSNLTTNTYYIHPLHQHIFSLSSSHPPTALTFVGLPALVPNCPTDFAQALLVSHVLASPSLLPTRRSMLSSLRSREQHYRKRGFDPFKVGHRLVDVDGHGNASYAYEESLVRFLREKGAIPDEEGKPYVEEWRRLSMDEFGMLWRAWSRVEGKGEEEVRRWLEGVREEEEWGDLMRRLVEWERGDEGDDTDVYE